EVLVAAELGTVMRRASQKLSGLDPEFLGRLSARQRERLRERESDHSYLVDYIPMSTIAPEQTAVYYDLRHYLRYDFILVSQAVRGRYLAEPARYPAQVRFYQDLDRYGTMVWRTGGDQGARTLEIRGYRLLPEGITALAHDRGSLRLAEIASTPLDPPTFVAFVNGVARAAMIKRDWSMAADYFSVLLEPPAVSQFSDD